VQSVPITTKVVSFNPADDEVYLIQHYVKKFISDFNVENLTCINRNLSIPTTKAVPKEGQIRQVSLYIYEKFKKL
jgi:hypothetical protein